MARFGGGSKSRRSVYKKVSDFRTLKGVNPLVPFRKARACTGPSRMMIPISFSSARMSYIETSPDAKPMPTTSMAGDCAIAVTEEGDEDSESWIKGILCMQELTDIYLGYFYIVRRDVPSTNVPKLQASVTAPEEDFVQIGSGMKKACSDKARFEMNLAM
jgi:hypothetical protein